MLTMNDLHQGVAVLEGGAPWIVLETDFMKKAQRRPVLRTKMRNLRTGQVKERTFKQGETISEAEVAKNKAQFIYQTAGVYTFMDEVTYEQYELSGDAVGQAAPLLRAGMVADVITFEGKPVVAQMPLKVEVKVVSAPPGVRGDSASNISKEVMVEGNVKVKTPLFIREGDVVVVDTRTGEYVRKAGE